MKQLKEALHRVVLALYDGMCKTISLLVLAKVVQNSLFRLVLALASNIHSQDIAIVSADRLNLESL